jgi:hypothetical protein
LASRVEDNVGMKGVIVAPYQAQTIQIVIQITILIASASRPVHTLYLTGYSSPR